MISPTLDVLALVQSRDDLPALASAWAGSDELLARWYAESLRAFLDGLPSKNSRRSYKTSLLHFFDAISRARAQRGGQVRLIPPHEVLESDVAGYARLLQQGGRLLPPELSGDQGERRLVELVEHLWQGSRGEGVKLAQIKTALGAQVEAGELQKRLGELCRKGALARRPRWRDPVYEQGDGKRRRRKAADSVSPEAFRYGPPAPSKPAASATIQARLIAVSTFFEKVMEPKNIRGMTSPIIANPAVRAMREALKVHASEARARTEAVKSTIEDLRLLRALIADYPGTAPTTRARDKLLCETLASMGLRVSEATGAKRLDLSEKRDGDDHFMVLKVIRKGKKIAHLRVPETVVEALREFDDQLLASKMDPEWVRLARSPEAPLIPATGRWGFASTSAEKIAEHNAESRFRLRQGAAPTHPALVPMTETGVRQIFRRYVEHAVECRSEEERRRLSDAEAKAVLFKRIHPHGLRHLYTQILIERGVEARVVAAMLGHADERTVLKTYAPTVDTTRVDFGSLVAAAVGGERVPLPKAPAREPTVHVEEKREETGWRGLDLVETRAADIPAPPLEGRQDTIQAIGSGVARATAFPASPKFAYEAAPRLVSVDGGGVHDAPPLAVSAGQLPGEVANDAAVAAGLVTLLPYRILRAGEGRMTTNPGGLLFVPVPCLEEAGKPRDLAPLMEVIENTVAGDDKRMEAVVLWTTYLLQSGEELRLAAAEADTIWLPFTGEEPAWNDPGESYSSWLARVRKTRLRAHDNRLGVSGFLERHATGKPPELEGGSFTPNSSRPRISERKRKLLDKAKERPLAVNLKSLILAFVLPARTSSGTREAAPASL